ncbi:hypothetical protein [Streptomyces sp. NPDC058872]|uniref:hypothetical protein n=1 Tax=Streptomyces sp. NPDC058872 TaxID=3346661 RepID=UPI003675D409
MTTFRSSRPVASASTEDRSVDFGRALFARCADDPVLSVVDLPDDLGVCLVHLARGGGKLYVAPDETVLFVGSAVDFEAGLKAFRAGVRTPREQFETGRGGAAGRSATDRPGP